MVLAAMLIAQRAFGWGHKQLRRPHQQFRVCSLICLHKYFGGGWVVNVGTFMDFTQVRLA